MYIHTDWVDGLLRCICDNWCWTIYLFTLHSHRRKKTTKHSRQSIWKLQEVLAVRDGKVYFSILLPRRNLRTSRSGMLRLKPSSPCDIWTEVQPCLAIDFILALMELEEEEEEEVDPLWLSFRLERVRHTLREANHSCLKIVSWPLQRSLRMHP